MIFPDDIVLVQRVLVGMVFEIAKTRTSTYIRQLLLAATTYRVIR